MLYYSHKTHHRTSSVRDNCRIKVKVTFNFLPNIQLCPAQEIADLHEGHGQQPVLAGGGECFVIHVSQCSAVSYHGPQGLD